MNETTKLILNNVLAVALVAGTVTLVALGKLPAESLVPTLLALLVRPGVSLPPAS